MKNKHICAVVIICMLLTFFMFLNIRYAATIAYRDLTKPDTIIRIEAGTYDTIYTPKKIPAWIEFLRDK